MRPPAVLFIIDGATGKILQSKELPNGLEAYTTPVFTRDGDLIVGTGGETTGGQARKIKHTRTRARAHTQIHTHTRAQGLNVQP